MKLEPLDVQITGDACHEIDLPLPLVLDQGCAFDWWCADWACRDARHGSE